jgi:hypothetical protein
MGCCMGEYYWRWVVTSYVSLPTSIFLRIAATGRNYKNNTKINTKNHNNTPEHDNFYIGYF